MTDLEVRRPRFDFTGEIPWQWNPQSPAFSFFMNATSINAICFERDGESRPAVAGAAFLRQEAQHFGQPP